MTCQYVAPMLLDRLKLTKVLREDVFRGVRDPVVNIESVTGCLKVAVVKCEKVLILIL